MLKVFVTAARPGISWLTQQDNSYLALSLPLDFWAIPSFAVNAVRPTRQSLELRPLHRHYLIQPSHCLVKMNYCNSSERLGDAKDPQLASGRGKVWPSSSPCSEAPHCRMSNESAHYQVVIVYVLRNVCEGITVFDTPTNSRKKCFSISSAILGVWNF